MKYNLSIQFNNVSENAIIAKEIFLLKQFSRYFGVELKPSTPRNKQIKFIICNNNPLSNVDVLSQQILDILLEHQISFFTFTLTEVINADNVIKLHTNPPRLKPSGNKELDDVIDDLHRILNKPRMTDNNLDI